MCILTIWMHKGVDPPDPQKEGSYQTETPANQFFESNNLYFHVHIDNLDARGGG